MTRVLQSRRFLVGVMVPSAGQMTMAIAVSGLSVRRVTPVTFFVMN